MGANDTQVGGDHYGGGEKQHWDFIQALYFARYYESCISKYVLRWRKKDGLRDLQKAKHFTQKLKELHVAGSLMALSDIHAEIAAQSGVRSETYMACMWSEHNQMMKENLRSLEATICWRLMYWSGGDDLDSVVAEIDELIKQREAIDNLRRIGQETSNGG